MKYYKRLNVYKASNVSFDPVKCQAYSYNWWKFVDKINGKVVFNSYGYSSSTGRHQYKVRKLLNQLGIKIDFEVESPSGLQKLDSAIRHYQYKIEKLQKQIDTPKSRKVTNLKRFQEIKELNLKIIEITNLMSIQELLAA